MCRTEATLRGHSTVRCYLLDVQPYTLSTPARPRRVARGHRALQLGPFKMHVCLHFALSVLHKPNKLFQAPMQGLLGLTGKHITPAPHTLTCPAEARQLPMVSRDLTLEGSSAAFHSHLPSICAAGPRGAIRGDSAVPDVWSGQRRAGWLGWCHLRHVSQLLSCCHAFCIGARRCLSFGSLRTGGSIAPQISPLHACALLQILQAVH